LAETIAAIATGTSLSAIGIIRISGDDAITVADKVFKAISGIRLAEAESRKMYYGEVTGIDGGIIDLCLCTVSQGPGSYTGEDTAEFHCHGSPVVLSEILRALFSHGVRQAEPGEFTKRAFLNGRMDLSQAEAVVDLIEAETSAAAQNAAGQLRGAVGSRLESVYSALLDIMAHFHALIDYPDEDIDDFEMQSYLPALRGTEKELEQLLSTHERGMVLRNGIPTVIIGRPNTGKSSLLNALLGYDRAIVTDISGTTRDTIEEKILLGGVLLRLIDTAGLRKIDDPLEKLGVDRALAALREAKLIILVLDGSEPLRDEDYEALRSVPPGVPRITAVNKSDLPSVLGINELSELEPEIKSCRVSALTGEGIETLGEEIKKLFPELSSPSSGETITSVRQAEAISRAKVNIGLAIASISEMVTPDAVLTDIEAAISAIGEITGKTMREDVVTRIFERFCVGK